MRKQLIASAFFLVILAFVTGSCRKDCSGIFLIDESFWPWVSSWINIENPQPNQNEQLNYFLQTGAKEVYNYTTTFKRDKINKKRCNGFSEQLNIIFRSSLDEVRSMKIEVRGEETVKILFGDKNALELNWENNVPILANAFDNWQFEYLPDFSWKGNNYETLRFWCSGCDNSVQELFWGKGQGVLLYKDNSGNTFNRQ